MGRIGQKNQDGSFETVIWGNVNKDPKVGQTPNKGVPKVTFGITYGHKQYMNCVCLGDTAVTRVASCLEKGDTVLAAGTWNSRDYTSRDGEQKTWAELKVGFLQLQQDAAGEAEDEEGTDGETEEEGPDEDYELSI